MDPAADRLGLLVELVTLSQPLEGTLRALAQHTFDPDAEMVALERGHVAAILQRYRSGELDEAALEAWADAIELRDDIALPDDDQMLRDLMFELANPEIAAPLSAARADVMLKMLTD
jgi:hypothetical protein